MAGDRMMDIDKSWLEKFPWLIKYKDQDKK